MSHDKRQPYFSVFDTRSLYFAVRTTMLTRKLGLLCNYLSPTITLIISNLDHTLYTDCVSVSDILSRQFYAFVH